MRGLSTEDDSLSYQDVETWRRISQDAGVIRVNPAEAGDEEKGHVCWLHVGQVFSMCNYCDDMYDTISKNLEVSKKLSIFLERSGSGCSDQAVGCSDANSKF